ncbi:hypothetical protein COU57_00505 [Candidatus Pacearchaeota archaeon CG10_big_fil_rev_8_21_14_0_10_32_14]|nr:MAG: hypothetical protein COU57_00505 [Candidatus Pacearchaeota archaeon CG10_big_fil_rev_8_21_14_0_10_32_14]
MDLHGTQGSLNLSAISLYEEDGVTVISGYKGIGITGVYVVGSESRFSETKSRLEKESEKTLIQEE